jgi:hypothetical protein
VKKALKAILSGLPWWVTVHGDSRSKAAPVFLPAA